MANITLRGNSITTSGELPKVGSKAPDFKLTTVDLKDVSLKDYAGKKKVLVISPSLDTGVCQTAARKFNEQAGKLPNTVVLLVTDDLPFAAKRFCTAEGLSNVTALSELRNRDFGRDYGVRITSGGMEGLLSRCIVVVDESDKVTYTQQVPEIAQEPDYDKAIAALK